MLFSEVYGTYFQILSELLRRAVEGELTRADMEAVIRERGYEESILAIPPNLDSGAWPLLRPDLTTPLRHPPERPLTLIEKQWLKALLQDPRIRLFDPPTQGLEDVEPLYPEHAFLWFDRYLDGDPFEDEGYIQRFRTILRAIREKRWLKVWFRGGKREPHHWVCIPYHLEYSPKDDKFRLLTGNSRTSLSINLARILRCELGDVCQDWEYQPRDHRRRSLILELSNDDRNSLERVMLHFSHLEKQTECIGKNRYRLTLQYEQEDETELLIRVLSFGPAVRVVAPERFRALIRQRLRRQNRLSRNF